MAYVILFVLVALAISPIIALGRKMITGKKAKYALFLNIAAFAAILALTFFGPLDGIIVGAVEAAGAGAIASSAAGMGYLSAAIVVSVGCIATGIAVSSAATTAISALTENPDIMGKAIIFVAMGEGIALYSIITAVLILNNL